MRRTKEKSTGEKKEKERKKQKQKLQDNTQPLSPPPTPSYKSTILPPCNNNTMDIEFVVQMRQSDKCGSVRYGDIFNLDLGSGVDP